MPEMKPLLTTLVFLLASCMPSIQGDDGDQRPVVTLPKFGLVRGRVQQSDNGARVNVFLGIPYAVPPVGDLRFKWTERLDDDRNVTVEADKMPPACPQYSEQPLPWYDLDPGQSEDCLYLNIWAPADVGKEVRPVKIYVHGGGWFDAGSIRMPYYDGFSEAIDTMDEEGNSKKDGIVVVTVNYRLGALGFLSTYTGADGDDAPGNMGLNDISVALNWATTYIQYFGGNDGYKSDSRNASTFMTLVGQGTGAILVSLVRLSNGNFFKMVLNGATFLTLQSLEGVDGQGDAYFNNLRLTDLLSKKLGCGSLNNSVHAIACLRGVEASRLMQVAASLSRGRGPPNVFLPQIYGPGMFTIRNPYMMLHLEKSFNTFDALATFTSDDGSALLTTAFPKLFGVFGEKDVPLSADYAKRVARRFLKKFPVTLADDILGDLDQSATRANRDKVVQAFGDAYFNCPMIFYAEELKRVHPDEPLIAEVHILEKRVNPPYNPWASWMGSVGFDNVQIDFVHPDGQLTVNNKTYTYTAEQSEQVRTNIQILRSFMTKQELPFPQFTLEDPAYGVLDSDGKISDEKKSNFHSRTCEILRPYYKYKKDEFYGYGYIIFE